MKTVGFMLGVNVGGGGCAPVKKVLVEEKHNYKGLGFGV